MKSFDGVPNSPWGCSPELRRWIPSFSKMFTVWDVREISNSDHIENSSHFSQQMQT